MQPGWYFWLFGFVVMMVLVIILQSRFLSQWHKMAWAALLGVVAFILQGGGLLALPLPHAMGVSALWATQWYLLAVFYFSRRQYYWRDADWLMTALPTVTAGISVLLLLTFLMTP